MLKEFRIVANSKNETTMHCTELSVANSWQNFSARSWPLAEKFGPSEIYPYRLLLLVFAKIRNAKNREKFSILLGSYNFLLKI
jgi:hypothetical protein